VTLEFDRPVDVARDDLQVVRGGAPGRPFTGFVYDPAGRTATWTLERGALAACVGLLLRIAGGEFRSAVDVLPGDATRDGKVNALDLSGVRRRLNRAAGEPAAAGGSGYDLFADVTADGRINSVDLAAVRQRLNTRVGGAAVSTVPLVLASSIAPPRVASTALTAAEDLFGTAPILPA
jgi:hypothetical protein